MLVGRKSSGVFFFFDRFRKNEYCQDRGWIGPSTSPLYLGLHPPANSKNEDVRTTGWKIYRVQTPESVPSQPVRAGPSFQTDLYKSCLSLRALSGWATVLLPFPLPPFPLHESLKVHREAGNRRCLLLFRRGSRCRQLEARVRKVDELFCSSLIRGISWWLFGNFKIVVRSSEDFWRDSDDFMISIKNCSIVRIIE